MANFVRGSSHLQPGHAGQCVDELAAFSSGGHFAAVNQPFAVFGHGRSDGGDGVLVRLEFSQADAGVAQLQLPRRTVGDEVQGGNVKLA